MLAMFLVVGILMLACVHLSHGLLQSSLLFQVTWLRNVTALIACTCCHFEPWMVSGSLDIKQRENYASDPRKILADFYSPGGGLGPGGVAPARGNLQTHWFAVYRPTSRDALAKSPVTFYHPVFV